MYSQNEEERFIVDYFKGITGRFIDIGAFDVFKFSNVRKLYELGWSGILVEPAPGNYKGIVNHYKDDPRIKVLNIAIGETTGEIDFYESNGDAVSTSNEEHMNKWGSAGVRYEKIKVKQVSVAEFMNKYCKDVDFLSIDTEATNYTVFKNIPGFVFQQIKMICIEHDGYQQQIESELSFFGFTTRYTCSENIILAK